jgi:hypothetical protein
LNAPGSLDKVNIVTMTVGPQDAGYSVRHDPRSSGGCVVPLLTFEVYRIWAVNGLSGGSNAFGFNYLCLDWVRSFWIGLRII